MEDEAGSLVDLSERDLARLLAGRGGEEVATNLELPPRPQHPEAQASDIDRVDKFRYSYTINIGKNS